MLFWGQRSLFEVFASFYHLIIASIFQLSLKRLFFSPRNALALKVRNRSCTLSFSKEKHFRNQRHCYFVIISSFPWKLGMTLAWILKEESFSLTIILIICASKKGKDVQTDQPTLINSFFWFWFYGSDPRTRNRNIVTHFIFHVKYIQQCLDCKSI